MEALKLEPKPDPRKQLIGAWKETFEKTTGKKCTLLWGRLMNGIYSMFEIPDEKTGEIFVEYPTLEEFQYQLDGFFTNDDFARQCNYSWNYFQKCYGKFHPKQKSKRAILKIHCSTCNKIHDVNEKCPQ